MHMFVIIMFLSQSEILETTTIVPPTDLGLVSYLRMAQCDSP